MSTYQVHSVFDLNYKVQNRYPELDWPIADLEIGQGFIVLLSKGRDRDGRPEAYIRVLADKIGNRLGRKFSCRKVKKGPGGSIAIIRTA